MLTIILNILLGFVIIFFEIERHLKKNINGLDFVRAFNIVYFIIYCIVPVYLLLEDLDPNILPSSGMWIYHIDYKDEYWSFMASLTAILGYISVIIGYKISISFPWFKDFARKINIKLSTMKNSLWLFISIFLFLLGVFSFVLFIRKLPFSLYEIILYAGILRYGNEVEGVSVTSFTLLTFSSIVLFSSYILLGLALNNIMLLKKRIFYIISFILSFIISILILIVRAGRLHIGNYFLVIFLSLYSRIKKKSFRFFLIILLLFIIMLLIIYGKYILGVRKEGTFLYNINSIFSSFIIEFSFPYLSLINIIKNVPNSYPYRYFLDLPLSILRILSGLIDKIIGFQINFPLNLIQANTLMIIGDEKGGIPVDIVGLGYYSFGAIGVVIIMFLYGLFLSFLEMIFSRSDNSLLTVLRIAFIIYSSTIVVLYADPVNVLWDGVYILFPFLILIAVYLFYRFIKYSLISNRI
jgi:oligosaccharide repeat unit polymerase